MPDIANLEMRFSPVEITRIIDQALVYQCACPAQVATTLLELRDLFDYQQRCANVSDTDRRVHEAIAQATRNAHAAMEQCMEEVLKIEGWDRDSLAVPEGMKKLPLKSL